MAGRTRSSSAAGRLSVLAGLASLATLPLAVAATRWSKDYDLLHAALAVPVAAALAVLALALAGREDRRRRRSLRGGGEAAARAGRFLGVVGLLVAVTAAMAVGVYAILVLAAD